MHNKSILGGLPSNEAYFIYPVLSKFFQTITAFMPKFDKYNDNIDIHLTTEQPSFLTKFIIDIKTQKATEERLLNLVVERPSYNSGVLARTITYLR